MNDRNYGTPPVRRSPLADHHRALGARFVASGEWPAAYGEVRRERQAIQERVALLDWGPLDKILLSGTIPADNSRALSFALGAIATGDIDGRPAQLWGLAEDEALLLVAGADSRSSLATAMGLEAGGATTTDLSSHYAAFRLAGPSARAVLEGLSAVDVSERGLADRAIRFGPLAGVTVTLARLDRHSTPAFEILVERDQAEYLWDSLLAAGAAFGIEPVGAAAMAED